VRVHDPGSHGRGLPAGRAGWSASPVRRNPVEVLAGVPADQAELAVTLLRREGIPVEVREVLAGPLPGVWVHVAASDARRARGILAAQRFPVPMVLSDEPSPDAQASEGAPGEDVWRLLMQ
jgi:hypothetical protein